MKRTLSMIAVACLAVLPAKMVAAHCEVPCGIYGDQRRFEEMLEDCETIAKALGEIQKLAGNHDPQSVNQTVRWVTTKEAHAVNTQHVIAQYFLAQRIKSDNPKYVEQLKAAHAVIVAAMKCKQTADTAAAETLKKSILDLYRAYEGKEPELEK